jgi:hypothetical protein
MKKILALLIVVIFSFSGLGAFAKNSETNLSSYRTSSFDDNIPPNVEITSPEMGFLYFHLFEKQLKISINPPFFTMIIGKIDIEVNATDNTGIDCVKFYIDDELKATISQAPYRWMWNEYNQFFPYTIKVTACDYAGNENSTELKVWKLQLFV